MKPCTVCGKDIEEPKYRIHEATCARNNYKCPKCKEIVSKSEKDHHEQEYHMLVRSHFSLDLRVIQFLQVKCQYCQTFEAEKKIVLEHVMYCEMKPQQCDYCEMMVPGGEKMIEHREYCGTKTQPCPDCKQNVLNRDLAQHHIHACKFNQELAKGKANVELYRF